MALTGIHIVCGRIATRFGASLMTFPDWSETLSVAGTTANAAIDGNSILQVSAAADSYFAVGKAPDATKAVGTGESSRYFLPAGATREVFCTTGDRVAWTLT